MQRRVRQAMLAAAILAAAALAAWWQSRPDGRLHLIFPELRGDALLIITPAGRTLLIDGGSEPAALPQLLGRQLPIWRRQVDALVLTSSDTQRLPGLVAVARRYRAGVALLPKPPLADDEHALVRHLQEQSSSVRVVSQRDSIELDGVRLMVVALDSERLALRLQYGSFTALLAPASAEGDLERLAESPAQLLFYPWHGPDDRHLAQRIGAQALVYGEGRLQRSRLQLRTYYERGSAERRLLHERINGRIELISDGARLWVLVERR